MSITIDYISGCLVVDVRKLRFMGGLLVTIICHKFNERIRVADR
jgi:hypothetical protein